MKFMRRLKDDERLATTKNIIKYWLKDGIIAVKVYLENENTKIWKNSWAGELKKLLDDNKYKEANNKIEMTVFNTYFDNTIKKIKEDGEKNKE